MPNPYSFTSTNPVVVGYDTEKPHYDAVFDNSGWLKYELENGYTGLGLKTWFETFTTPAIASNILALDLSAGRIFKVALNAAINTLTISNVPAAVAVRFELILTADGTPRVITWPASVHWPGGVAPTPTSTATYRDRYVFSTEDGGTTWDVAKVGQAFQ